MALKVTLDTRFYFSYYNPEDEKTFKWVKSIINMVTKGKIKAYSSVLTITEFYKTMGRIVGADAVKLRINSIKASKITFVPVSEEIAEVAGMILHKNPHIPIGDATIAATAIKNSSGIIYTDDPHFSKIEGIKAKWTT